MLLNARNYILLQGVTKKGESYSIGDNSSIIIYHAKFFQIQFLIDFIGHFNKDPLSVCVKAHLYISHNLITSITLG